MTALLSRHAACIYWMGRYIERAENLARILDVNETYSRDSRGGQNWRSIVELYNDKNQFDELYEDYDDKNVLSFYVLDSRNPSSLVSAVQTARENARTLRPLISTEMWVHMNVFSNWIRGTREEDLKEGRLSRLCMQVRQECQAHTGITEGTFYRDESWYFYQLGRMIERADQTTRLLDVKYHMFLPSLHDVGSALDVSQWNALLRSAAGYHAFRRVYPTGFAVPNVVAFLLFNDSFPRSVHASIGQFESQLTDLRQKFQLMGGADALGELYDVRTVLSESSVDAIMTRGLHEFLDWTQQRIISVGDKLSADFFS
ncbi:MAG: alpha-E domain-containing protein [Pseudomonadota bacterium]